MLGQTQTNPLGAWRRAGHGCPALLTIIFLKYNLSVAIVYALSSSSSPELIRYVGRTKHEDPNRRLKDHLWNARKDKPYHVYNWIRQVISSGSSVIITVLENNLSWEDSGTKEAYYIKKLKSEGYDLTNMTEGGEGSIGVVRSVEYRRKLSASHTGKKFSPEHIDNLRNVWVGRKHSLETRQKISQSQKGRIFSEETRMKMSLAAKNRVLKSQET